MDYGRTSIGIIGTPFSCTADGKSAAKIGGVSIDWTVFATNNTGANVVVGGDNYQVPPGYSYIRYGQILCRITLSGNTGLFGPYDPAATDGRALLNRGDCFIANTTVCSNDPRGTHPECIYGGLVWFSRLIVTAGTASLANGPTKAAFEAAFPMIQYVNESQ